uniref:Transthyretin-like family protein n=1 Tax=Strongyloides papillosus TaxID=174720 RepID=A0A0N5BQU8_STREA
MSNIVKSNSNKVLLTIHATPNSPKSHKRPPVADNAVITVKAIMGHTDGNMIFPGTTGVCGQRITFKVDLPKKEIDKGIYYVGFFFSNGYSSIIKKIPEDCKYTNLERPSWICELGDLNPYLDRSGEIKELYKKFLQCLEISDLRNCRF